jgi:hypothetical protein
MDKDFTVKINLEYSINVKKKIVENGIPKVQENEVRELTLRRLQGKHLRQLPENAYKDSGDLHPSAIIPLIAFSADIPIEAADDIDLRDLDEVASALLPFLPKSLGTGGR